MDQARQLTQIRNGVYALCVITLVTLAVSIFLNIHLTERFDQL